MANSNLTQPSADTGSTYSFRDRMKKANAPRSVFNLEHLSTFDIANAGIVYPICKPIETVPGDSFDISVTNLIRYMTQVVPLYSRQRMYVYAFYSRNSDLWENWETFEKKGLNGNKILELPTLKYIASGDDAAKTNILTDSSHKYITAGSLGDMMGLPIGLDIYNTPENDGFNGELNALPFMMYLRIWRDYFSNPNLFLSLEEYNECLFPDNDDDFRLNNDGNIISFVKKSKTFKWDIIGMGDDYLGINIATDGTKSNNTTMGLFFQNWADDEFTDALPFPMRGDTPEITLEATLDRILKENWNNTGIMKLTAGDWENGYRYQERIKNQILRPGAGDEYTNVVAEWMGIKDTVNTPAALGSSFEDDAKFKQVSVTQEERKQLGIFTQDLGDWINANTVSDISLQTTLTLNKIRELGIEQNELEKMAMTDGSYEQFIETFYGVRPKNARNYKPELIGATYTDIHFTEVLQTSANSGDQKLGSYAGHGIGGMSGEYLGHVNCDDFGYIMILACIAPDTYYCQGLDKMYTKKLQSEFLLPERARMGMIPILNKEIFAMGTTETNEGLFGYKMPFDEMRYRANEIHGKIADTSSTSFKPYTQARIFADTPTLNYKFDEMRSKPNAIESSQPSGGVRKDYLAAQTESMCTVQFKIDMRAVRPIPYKASPAEIIN